MDVIRLLAHARCAGLQLDVVDDRLVVHRPSPAYAHLYKTPAEPIERALLAAAPAIVRIMQPGRPVDPIHAALDELLGDLR